MSRRRYLDATGADPHDHAGRERGHTPRLGRSRPASPRLRRGRSVAVTAVAVVVVLAGVGVGTTPVASRPAGGSAVELLHPHPNWNATALYVEAELVEVEVTLPVPDGGYPERVLVPRPVSSGGGVESITREQARSRLASRLYGGIGGFSENPDYVVVLGFRHEGIKKHHGEIRGTAWVDDYQDDFADGGKRVSHPLYSEPGGINEFGGDSGGYDTGMGRDEGVTVLSNQRFLLSGPDKYAHVHCGPDRDMRVEVTAYEVDEGTGRRVAGILANVPTSIDPTPLSSMVAGELITHGVNPDHIGEGEAVLSPNGVTTVDLTFNASMTSDYGGLELQPPEDHPLHGERTGTLRFRTRTVKLEDVWQDVPLQDLADAEAGGHLSNAARAQRAITKCIDDQYIVPGDGDGVVDSTTLVPVTPTPDAESAAEQGAYYRSMESATRLALVLRDERVPVSRVPGQFRGLAVGQRANVQVGETTIGVVTDRQGRFSRPVLGGFADPSLRVAMSPETADEVVYAEDRNRAQVAARKIERGEITYHGVGTLDEFRVSTLKAGLGGYRLYRRAESRVARVLPSRYDLEAGARKSITYRGRPALLERNSLGHRTLDTGRETLLVVDRTGRQRGVTTRGAQRLIGAGVPSGWTRLSDDAGVYASRTGGWT